MALAPRRLLLSDTVELAQDAVHADLIESAVPAQRLGDVAVDGIDGLSDALAAEAAFVAVAQFHGLAGSGGSARRHGGPARRTAVENDFDFDGGISPAVEDFKTANAGDCCHD